VTAISIPNGFDARSAQADLMRYFDKGGKRAAVCWPRRFGKDLTALHQTAKEALERPGMYMHMLPNHKQARKVVWDGFDNQGRKTLDQVFPLVLREQTNQTEMKITLKNGAIWQLVGSDYYDSLVGSNPFGIVMSEAALSDPRAWSMFRPILAGNDGWAMHISTPRGYNHFHDIIKLAKKGNGWHHSHLTALQTGHIRPEVLAQEQAEMPDELFRQEYMCDFSAANVGAIFGRYIEQAEKDGRICELSNSFDGEVWVTADIGYRDKSAFVWWRRMRGGFEIYHYDDASGLDADEWVERLRKQPAADVLVLPHDARAKNFQSKRSAVETFLTNPPWSGVDIKVNTQRRKSDSINAGRLVLRKLRISSAPVCEPFLAAMRAYAFKYDEKTKTFSSDPEHNWASHPADAYMEGAARMVEIEPAPAPKKIVVPPLHNTFQLERLWDTVGASPNLERI
jgi:phage terminase large subunit